MRGERGRGHRHDAGSATVWILALAAVIAAVATTAGLTGAASVARHRAGVAADLAALAAAGDAVYGETVACARARVVAAANGAHLSACRLDGLDAVVTVAVTGTAGTAGVTARAGPFRAPA